MWNNKHAKHFAFKCKAYIEIDQDYKYYNIVTTKYDYNKIS